MEEILRRRSIRKFRDDPVAEENVKVMLEAGMAAPSAMNRRPYHFVVIEDREVLDSIPGIHPYAAMATRAPIAIVVCADTDVQPDPGYFSQDCSAATQNILLAATGLDLGSVWCGIYPRKERIEGFASLLKLPEGVVPFSLVVIGHPGEFRSPHGGVEADRVHENVW